MRTRTALVAAMTAAALVISPLALADPLDPDPSFGGDGIIKIDGIAALSSGVGRTTAGHATVTAPSWPEAATPEAPLVGPQRSACADVTVVTSAAVRAGGMLEPENGWPQAVDVLTTDHRSLRSRDGSMAVTTEDAGTSRYYRIRLRRSIPHWAQGRSGRMGY